ncbi:Abi-like protein [Enterococcus faecalis 06-MB-DW-09]|nr:Abi-like protein [Enterococcus faecalis 06-MB-DW-09]
MRRCIFLSRFQPDKPFLDYPELIGLLKSRNLIITDNDTQFAIHALQTYSYYDLVNGNVERFLQSNRQDEFADGITIQLLVRVKLTEERLRSTFLSQILAIEKTFCTRLSWYIAKTYGVESRDGGYLKKSNYSSSNKALVSSTMKRLRAIRDLNFPSRKPSPSLVHYHKNHIHIPPWILINDLMFGEVLNWYRCLDDASKNIVSENLFLIELPDRTIRVSLLIELLDLLREYRNFFAHNTAISKMRSSRTLDNKLLRESINLPNLIAENEFSKEKSNNLYACFIAILLLSPNSDQLKVFLISIEQIYSSIDTKEQEIIFEETFGLPPKIFEIANSLIERL